MLKLPDLQIANKTNETTFSIKFFGVILDENITWKDHIDEIEKNIAKNLCLLYRAKQLLNEEFLKFIYFSYIHSYLNYANVVWASTYYTKLKTIYYQQKHAARIILHEHNLSHSRPLLRSLSALNVYQINLYQHLNFMYKLNNKQTPRTFRDLIEKPIHQYPTQFSKISFNLKEFFLGTTKYSISYRGTKVWKIFFKNEEKEMQSYFLLLSRTKSKFFDAENKQKYF